MNNFRIVCKCFKMLKLFAFEINSSFLFSFFSFLLFSIQFSCHHRWKPFSSLCFACFFFIFLCFFFLLLLYFCVICELKRYDFPIKFFCLFFELMRLDSPHWFSFVIMVLMSFVCGFILFTEIRLSINRLAWHLLDKIFLP